MCIEKHSRTKGPTEPHLFLVRGNELIEGHITSGWVLHGRRDTEFPKHQTPTITLFIYTSCLIAVYVEDKMQEQPRLYFKGHLRVRFVGPTAPMTKRGRVGSRAVISSQASRAISGL